MKKTLLLSSLLLALAASSYFADALLFTVGSTPYDHQMARIRPVLTASAHSSGSQVSISLVNQWMSDLRSIPYGFTAVWKTPAEAQSGAPADCKAKAVALYKKMRENGATNVRLVIGKRTSSSRQTHAWLAWETEDGSFVLDPTFNYTACTTAQAGKRNYQPLYAYAGSKKFRAASTLVAQN
ncbi:MAG: Bacterial transglutaminase-like cysteine proteinase [Verrucomicrobiota bacterium]|jgi:predicted transglutaminase-like cysteine proteinase